MGRMNRGEDELWGGCTVGKMNCGEDDQAEIHLPQSLPRARNIAARSQPLVKCTPSAGDSPRRGESRRVAYVVAYRKKGRLSLLI